MFTGIIEQTAAVVAPPGPAGGPLTVSPRTPWTDLVPGESVAVNGACLTVTAFDAATITFDVVGETARLTNLTGQRPGVRVNLERSLRVGDRFGGHYVLGHIDCLGTIRAAAREGPEPRLAVSFPAGFEGLLVSKGSIAVNGVSLTLGSVEPQSYTFTVYLVPFTLRETNLADLAAGQAVNLEFDYFGKWAVSRYERAASSRLGEALKRAGFVGEDEWNE